MPTPAEKLTPKASKGEISAAISESIAMLMDEGMPQDQAVATAYSMAEQATGGKVKQKKGGPDETSTPV
ncbi:MAG: hypothetical protein M0R06_00170 [Sphaerochaeta sp.]|jgi:hypothetical protein|nr:hypothetical protein [Sphaerochaeta sp.]